MNKIRVIGLIILIAGIVLHFGFDNEGIDFLTGILIGLGGGLLVTGQLKKTYK